MCHLLASIAYGCYYRKVGELMQSVKSIRYVSGHLFLTGSRTWMWIVKYTLFQKTSTFQKMKSGRFFEHSVYYEVIVTVYNTCSSFVC